MSAAATSPLPPLVSQLPAVPEAGPFALNFVESGDRSHALAIWKAVQNERRTLPLMASFDWTESWLKHFGDVVPHRFATLQGDSRYLGITLLTQGVDERRQWLGERAWHVGTAGEPDGDSVCVEYNALACTAGFEKLFWQQLVAALLQQTDWDALKVDGFAAADLPAWMTESETWQVVRKPARWMNLDAMRATGREVITFLGDSTRKAIRQNLRQMPDIRFEWAETADHAHDVFDDLVRLHQHRWNAVGQPGCYASPRFTDFHRELIDRLAVKQQVVLARISSADQVLACSQLIVDQGRALVYQGGRLLEDNRSLGLVMDFLCMQECLVRGYSAFDFMAGDSMHKKRLTNLETPLCWATWKRPRLKYRLKDVLRRTRDFCRSALRRSAPELPAIGGKEA